MMNTKRVAHGCVIATLLLIATSSMASQPAGHAGPSKQTAKPPPRRCVAVAQAENGRDGRPAPSDGQRAGLRALPLYVHDLLRDTGKADLDGATDPCRLVDKQPDDDVAENDGLDKHKLLDQIDDWMAVNRRSLVDDAHELDGQDWQVQFEFEGADHRMHAYVGHSRIDGDRLYRTSQQRPAWPWHDGAAASAVPGQLYNALGQDGQPSMFASNTQPVPEADAWAMLLAGLALIGLAVRRRAA